MNYQAARLATEERVTFTLPPAALVLKGVSVKETNVTTYSEKLKDPRWQRRRLEILNRSDFACEVCLSKTKTLHVHHKLYRKGAQPWEYADHELAALCEDCHETDHGIRAEIEAAMAKLDMYDLERVLGYAHAQVLAYAWEADDVTKLPPLRIRSMHHASGLADGLWLDFPQIEMTLPIGQDIRIVELLNIESEAVRLRRSRYE